MSRPIILITTLILLSIASFTLALTLGSYSISLHDVVQTLIGNQTGIEQSIVMDLRAPRAYE